MQPPGSGVLPENAVLAQIQPPLLPVVPPHLGSGRTQPPPPRRPFASLAGALLQALPAALHQAEDEHLDPARPVERASMRLGCLLFAR